MGRNRAADNSAQIQSEKATCRQRVSVRRQENTGRPELAGRTNPLPPGRAPRYVFGDSLARSSVLLGVAAVGTIKKPDNDISTVRGVRSSGRIINVRLLARESLNHSGILLFLFHSVSFRSVLFGVPGTVEAQAGFLFVGYSSARDRVLRDGKRRAENRRAFPARVN